MGTPTTQNLNPLTLDEALRLANLTASSFQQATFNERIAAEDVKQAQAAFLPKVSAPLSYVYLPAQRTLNRVKDGQSKPLLEQCDQLQFAIYQRTPIANSFDLITASKLPDCKVVTITWSCSRMIFGHKANTEQGQTAKIVIRNKNEL